MTHLSMRTGSRWPKPLAVVSLLANADDVMNLVGIHEHLTGSRPGRRRNVEVLNKTSVVLLVACWEAFVEDLASTAFDFIASKAESADAIPATVRTYASKPLRESKDEREVWKLAGDGWRGVIQAHRSAVLDRYVGKLNTPKPDQVDDLLSHMIGVPKLSEAWHWRGASVAVNRQRLEALVTLRGEIAHRVRATRSVHKKTVTDSVDFIHRLAVTSSNEVAQFVFREIGSYPWRPVAYGAVG